MIRRTLVLTSHSLARIRGVLLGISLMLAGFQFLLTQVAGYLMTRGAFNQLSALIPDFVRTAAGPSALAFMSFSGIVGLGYFHPVVMAALVGQMIAIATEPAGEVETRFVDLVLARPVARFDVILRTVLVIVISGTLMLAAMTLGTWTGLTCCAPAGAETPPLRLILSLALTLASVMICWAGVALAIAAAVKRRSVGASLAGILALAAYLLDYLGRAWDPARAISSLSPFHYFEPMALVMGQPLDLTNVSVLAGIGLAGVAIGSVVFARRDV